MMDNLPDLAGAEIVELFEQAVQLVADTLDVELCAIFELQPIGDILRLIAGVGMVHQRANTAAPVWDLLSQSSWWK